MFCRNRKVFWIINMDTCWPQPVSLLVAVEWFKYQLAWLEFENCTCSTSRAWTPHVGIYRLKYLFCKAILQVKQPRAQLYQLGNFPQVFVGVNKVVLVLNPWKLILCCDPPAAALGNKIEKFEWKIWIICHKVETTKWLKIPCKLV